MQNIPNRGPGHTGDSGSGGLVTEQVKQGTQQAVQQTRESAGQVADRAQSTALSYADTQKRQASQTLHSIAQAVRQSGENLQSQNQPSVAKAAADVASRIDGAASYLEGTAARDMIRDTEDFARRHSALFLGGAFALGLAAARFIKASAPAGTGAADNRYSYGSTTGYDRFTDRETYASGAPSGDVGYEGTPSITGTYAPAEGEYSNAAEFDAEPGTETTDGTAR